jgi:hypothetical protein
LGKLAHFSDEFVRQHQDKPGVPGIFEMAAVRVGGSSGLISSGWDFWTVGLAITSPPIPPSLPWCVTPNSVKPGFLTGASFFLIPNPGRDEIDAAN